jgi:hypothetical protein
MTDPIVELPEITVIEEESADSMTKHKHRTITIRASNLQEAYEMYIKRKQK